MRLSILFCFLLCTSFLYSQDYTDTIYYKNGKIHVGDIYNETESAINYKYRNSRGKEKNLMARKQYLNGYTVGDKQNSIVSSWTSPNPVSTSSSVEIKEKEKQKNRNKNTAKPIIIGSIIAFGAGVFWWIFGVLF